MGCVQSTDDDAEEGFSQMLPERARSVISSVAEDGAKHHSLYFNSFQAAASAFLDVNSYALDNISKLEDEISSNPDLVHFVIEYLNSSNDTVLFLTAVKKSLQKARKAELLVHEAVVLFEKFHDHKSALEKLQKFMEEGNRFTENFINAFQLVIEGQNSILQDLRKRKKKLDCKLCNVKAWRKVLEIVYYAAYAGVLISALVLAALAAPTAVIAPFMAASGAMPPLQKLINWVWDNFQSPLEGERDVITSLWKGTAFAIHELNNIKALVEQLKIQKIESTNQIAEFAIEEKEEPALKMAMVAIKVVTETFAKSVNDMEIKVDQSVEKLKETTITILEKFPDSLKKKKRLFRCPCMKFIKKKKPISHGKLGRKSARDLRWKVAQRKLKDV